MGSGVLSNFFLQKQEEGEGRERRGVSKAEREEDMLCTGRTSNL